VVKFLKESLLTNDILQLKDITKSYPQGAKRITVVDRVSLSLKKGEILGLVGESGSGKSTLARLAMRLIEADAGNVFLDGENISYMQRGRLSFVRRKIQMVFQNPLLSFNPKLKIETALKEVCAFYKYSAAETVQKTESLLAEIGLHRDVLARYPSELSGGQLQRLAIARALICNPAVLIADEPVSALDVSIEAQLLNLFSQLQERLNLSMIFISHDMSVIQYLCDRVAVMYKGAIVEEGTVEQVFNCSQHEYTKSLIAAAPAPLSAAN
jgi:ABC-type glutathione transport system ATPase component